ncbi:PLDc N-terminal domain-containing protein [Ohtaekwangia sp.]|uniref:PLDc N-terminal domain-containing protein n=1 Tax=Ohtaekwangia sp. TaxID=2066019 RepID=UPI0039C9B6EA
MELLTPGIGLLIWQVLIFVIAILFVVSWIIILRTKTLDSRDRLSWLLGTLLLPVIGPLIFLTKYLRTGRQKN